jgi:nucleoside-diphosphate-sugar epimerase
LSKPLVLGANSFIGRHVVTRLGEVFVSTRSGALACDVRSRTQVNELVKQLRPSGIVNCTGVVDSENPAVFYDTHVSGTLHLLEAQRSYVPHAPIILLGTAAEYGPAPPLTSEDYPAQPQTFYGASKLAQTQLAMIAKSQWRVPVFVLRLFNVIGPGLPDHYFLGALGRRFLQAPPGTIIPVMNSEATRDFVDVRDVVEAINMVLQGVGTSGVVNVCTGLETSLGTAGSYLAQLAGQKIVSATSEDSFRVQVSRSAGNPQRLRSWGWRPRYTWQQSIRDFWDSLCSKPSD